MTVNPRVVSSELFQQRKKAASQVNSGLDDFSLVLGGPLYQIYLRTRLVKPPVELWMRRAIVIPLFAWLPLLLLSLISGTAIGGVEIPFLRDLDVHIRFLAALPLLIIAEPIVHKRMTPIVHQFIDRGIIAPEDEPRFNAIIDSTMRLRNSVTLEIVLLVISLFVGHWIWRHNVALDVSTWYAIKTGESTRLTLAGYWFAWISLPVARFILLRWYFRLFLWYRLLWQIQKLPLRLNLFHPDPGGGLGFLSGSLFAFAPVLQAHTVLLAALIGNRIWHTGANLLDFKLDTIGVMVYLLLLICTPLFFFMVHLSRARRRAAREFGILASHYVEDFRGKWTLHGLPRSEPILGNPDFQSLADLANGFQVVVQIQLVPLNKNNVIQLAAFLLLPFLPLLFTIMPIDQVLGKLLKIVL